MGGVWSGEKRNVRSIGTDTLVLGVAWVTVFSCRTRKKPEFPLAFNL
jgi:hypothetical protein